MTTITITDRDEFLRAQRKPEQPIEVQAVETSADETEIDLLRTKLREAQRAMDIAHAEYQQAISQALSS